MFPTKTELGLRSLGSKMFMSVFIIDITLSWHLMVHRMSDQFVKTNWYIVIQILFPLPGENNQIIILIWRDFPLIWLGGIFFKVVYRVKIYRSIGYRSRIYKT